MESSSLAIHKNPLIISTSKQIKPSKPPNNKLWTLQWNNNNFNPTLTNLNNYNNNTSRFSNNHLNTSITNDTIKILNLLKTQPNHQSSIPEYSYEDLKSICMKIFMAYAKPTNGQFFLSYGNWFKILRYSNILNETTFKTKDAEILSQKINKGIAQFTSDNFLDYIARICSMIDPSFYNDQKGSIINLVKNNLEPLLLKIERENRFDMSVSFTPMNGPNHMNSVSNTSNLNNNSMKANTGFHNNSINKSILQNISNVNLSHCFNFQKFLEMYCLDENTYSVLVSISPAWKQIYLIYFVYENGKHSDWKKVEKGSLSDFKLFAKDFEMTPYLISKDTLELYWSIVISTPLENLINNTNIPLKKFSESWYRHGKVFILLKFILFFSHWACYYYFTMPNLSNAEKLLYLIEKIYHSKGYKNLNKKTSSTFNKQYSLIPSKEVIEWINKKWLDNEDKFEIQRLNYTTNYDNWHSNLQDFLEINNETFNLLEPYIERLRNLFGIYSKIGDKLQYGRLTFSNYQKMLTVGDLLNFKKRSMSTKTIHRGGELKHKDYKYNTIQDKNKNWNISLDKVNKNENCNHEEKLSKSLSQQWILVPANDYFTWNKQKSRKPSTEVNNNNNNDTSDINSTSIAKPLNFDNKTPKKRLSIADINLIYTKVSGIVNYKNYKEHLTTRVYRHISFQQSHWLNMSMFKENVPFKLDFFLFMKTLPWVALRWYPNESYDKSEAWSQLIRYKFETFISKISAASEWYNDNTELIQLIECVSQNNTLIQLMEDISPIIKVHYANYSYGKKRKIFFENFIHFFKDFDIYPQWMSLVNLKEIFYCEYNRSINNFDLSSGMEKTKFSMSKTMWATTNPKDTEEFLLFSGFMECIIVIGICMNTGEDFSWSDKVWYMWDKMFIDGGQKSLKKTGNPYTQHVDFGNFEKILRKKYPDYYRRKYGNCDYRYDNKMFLNVTNISMNGNNLSNTNINERDLYLLLERGNNVNFENAFLESNK